MNEQEPQLPAQVRTAVERCFAQMRLARAAELAQSKRFLEAEALLLPKGELPESLRELDLLARIAAQQRQFARARHLWQAVLEKDPTHEPAKEALAKLGSPWIVILLMKRIVLLVSIAVGVCLAVLGIVFLTGGGYWVGHQGAIPLGMQPLKSRPTGVQHDAEEFPEPKQLAADNTLPALSAPSNARDVSKSAIRQQRPAESIPTSESFAALSNQLIRVGQQLADLNRELKTSKAEIVSLRQANTPSTQLVDATHQVATLQNELATSRAEVASLRQQVISTVAERADSSQRSNDPNQSRVQIGLAKQRAWEMRVAHRKQANADAARGGNGGLLLRDGKWQSVENQAGSRNE